MKKLTVFFTVFFFGILFLESCNRSNAREQADNVYLTAEDMVDKATEVIEEISVTDFHELLNASEYFLIDVRNENEHNSGYIPGSVLITRGLLEFQIAKKSVWDKAGMYLPKKNDLIIIYCKKGNRAALAAKTLQEMGYTNVKSIKGGWVEWKNTYPELFDEDIPEGQAHVKSDEGGC